MRFLVANQVHVIFYKTQDNDYYYNITMKYFADITILHV